MWEIGASGWFYYKEICYDTWSRERGKKTRSGSCSHHRVPMPRFQYSTCYTSVFQPSNSNEIYAANFDALLIIHIFMPKQVINSYNEKIKVHGKWFYVNSYKHGSDVKLLVSHRCLTKIKVMMMMMMMVMKQTQDWKHE